MGVRPPGASRAARMLRRGAALAAIRAVVIEAAGGALGSLPRVPRRKREEGEIAEDAAPPRPAKRVRFAPEVKPIRPGASPPEAIAEPGPPREAVELVKSLNPEQMAAIHRIVRGSGSVFVDGPAGVGKSYLLGALRAVLEARKKRVVVTAWSGLAARSVGGSTFASVFQLGRGRGVPEVYEIVRRAEERRRGRGLTDEDSPWRADVLLVEEVSCLPATAIDIVDHVARAVRGEPGQPFGGMRVIFFGDFFQLPPTAEGEWCAQSGRLLETTERFAFESCAWKLLAPERIELRTPMRQSDPALVRALLEARRGRLSDESRAIFRARVGSRGLPDRETRLYGSNARVDRENDGAIAALPGPGRVYRSVESLSASDPAAADALAARMRIPPRLELRVGARVLFTANLPSNPLVRNGVAGRVVGFEHAMGTCGLESAALAEEWRKTNGPSATSIPVVEIDGGERVRVHPFSFEIEGRVVRRGGLRQRESLGAVAQLPLRLAHAVTITRAQGLSFDGVRVAIDRHNAFLPGMAYVALSRCRSLDGLALDRFDEGSVAADPRVIAFYGGLS